MADCKCAGRTTIKLANLNDGDVTAILRILRQFIIENQVDIKMDIAFPESPALGYLTPPYCRGGPFVLINLSAPTEQKHMIECFVSDIRRQLGVDGPFTVTYIPIPKRVG